MWPYHIGILSAKTRLYIRPLNIITYIQKLNLSLKKREPTLTWMSHLM